MTPERKREVREPENYIRPILQILQENGGELEDISQIGRLLPSYSNFTEDELNYSETTSKGNIYTPYRFGRNFALKSLQIAGYITYSRNEPIKLTPEGLSLNLNNFDIERDINTKTRPYWEKKNIERKERYRQKGQASIEASDLDEPSSSNEAIDIQQDYKTYILDKVKALEPIKFERFARGLLQKMNLEIDPIKGIAASGDNGIDGFAYCLDDQSLKTTRVAIQCKRYTNGAVGSPEINNLRGAIDTNRADYGVLITTSYFSKEAIESSRMGSTPITLIDGERLVDLMIQYQYKVREVPTYVVDEQYFGE